MLTLILTKLFEISLRASFLILVVLFIRLIFRNLSRNFVCLLWMLVAVRLILPFEITSNFSLQPDTDRVLELAGITSAELSDNSAHNTGTMHSNNSEASSDTAAFEHSGYIATNKHPENTYSDTATITENRQPSTNVQNDQTNKTLPVVNTAAQPIVIQDIFTAIWILGATIILAYGLISYIRIRLLLSDAVHTEKNIWLSNRIDTPFVCGYFKPHIYIPFSVEEAQLPYIIAHESAHIDHFDHFGKLSGFLLLSIYWFNPFIWVAYYCYCKDLELACDERVINTLGNDAKKAYSEALLTCSVSNKALLQSPLSFSELSVKERIINILNYKKPGLWSIIAAILLCIFTAVCFLTDPQTSKNDLNEKIFETDLTETEFTETNVTEQKTNPWASYADQINAFPGEVKQDADGNLIAVMNTADYEAVATTDPDTGAPAYYWREPNAKTYPLEIINETLQDIPARIVSTEEFLNFPYGETLMQQILKLYPHGIYQFILRENGILHVNVGQEDGTFLNLQYLEYKVSEDGQTAVLTDSGFGYYLLQINDVKSLEAFRHSFTGEGHTLPADTSHLPWEWLLTMNGEESDAPDFTFWEKPVAEHLDMYDYFTDYNISGRIFNGFYVYENRDNDKPIYEYRYYDEAGDIVILMKPIGAQYMTTIQYNGKEKEADFPGPFHGGGAGGSYAYPYLTDVTGDGKPELILAYGGGGTGAFTSECYIYQLDTLEQLMINTNIYDITSRLSVTLTEFHPEEGDLHYLLEYNGQIAECNAKFDAESEKHASIMSPGVTLEAAAAYFSYLPFTDLYQSYYAGIDLNPESGKLEASVAFSTNNILPGAFIGELNFSYIFDSASGAFVPNPESVILTGY